jgi:hypothetical protein
MHHAAQDLEARLHNVEQLVSHREAVRNARAIPLRNRGRMTGSQRSGPLTWSTGTLLSARLRLNTM